MDTDVVRQLTKAIELQTQLIQDQLLPGFNIVSILVKILPSEEQQRLLTLLRSLAEDVELLAQAEGIESPYAKAVEIVSQLVSGGTGDFSVAQKLELIQGRKKDA